MVMTVRTPTGSHGEFPDRFQLGPSEMMDLETLPREGLTEKCDPSQEGPCFKRSSGISRHSVLLAEPVSESTLRFLFGLCNYALLSPFSWSVFEGLPPPPPFFACDSPVHVSDLIAPHLLEPPPGPCPAMIVYGLLCGKSKRPLSHIIPVSVSDEES